MLYLLWWLIFLILISKYKTFKLKDYWNTLIVWIFSIIIVLLFWVIWRPWYENEIIDWFRNIRQYFVLFREYNIHLITQLWILYVIWIFQIIHSLIKKNRKEILLFVIPFILFFLAIIFKSNLFALRYTLILFPIIILLSIIWIYNIVSYFKNKKIKIWILIWIWVWILFTVKFQFVPKVYYMLDITSPQSDFKSAYENIPDNQNVISWMPTLCERYYWNRWLCLASIRVDLISNDDNANRILTLNNEQYTKLPYIDSIEQLPEWTYYFVFDALTRKSKSTNDTLQSELSKYWERIYRNWIRESLIFITLLNK